MIRKFLILSSLIVISTCINADILKIKGLENNLLDFSVINTPLINQMNYLVFDPFDATSIAYALTSNTHHENSNQIYKITNIDSSLPEFTKINHPFLQHPNYFTFDPSSKGHVAYLKNWYRVDAKTSYADIVKISNLHSDATPVFEAFNSNIEIYSNLAFDPSSDGDIAYASGSDGFGPVFIKITGLKSNSPIFSTIEIESSIMDDNDSSFHHIIFKNNCNGDTIYVSNLNTIAIITGLKSSAIKEEIIYTDKNSWIGSMILTEEGDHDSLYITTYTDKIPAASDTSQVQKFFKTIKLDITETHQTEMSLLNTSSALRSKANFYLASPHTFILDNIDSSIGYELTNNYELIKYTGLTNKQFNKVLLAKNLQLAIPDIGNQKVIWQSLKIHNNTAYLGLSAK